jgi:hypothetical protein
MSDVSALVAAAFHYCSLVGVREREVRGEETVGGDPDATIKYLCALAGSGIEAYSPHSMKIALDAARLKAAEALAQTVVRPTAGGIVGDASNLRSLLLSVNGVGDWRALAIRSAACLYRLDGLKRWREAEGFDGRRTKEEARAGYEALHIYAPLGELFWKSLHGTNVHFFFCFDPKCTDPCVSFLVEFSQPRGWECSASKPSWKTPPFAPSIPALTRPSPPCPTHPTSPSA